MPCEIETKRSRPEGPFGRVDIRAHCKVHNFVVHGAEIGEICPIGQIEAARDEALAALGKPTPSNVPNTYSGSTEPAPADDGTRPEPPPKRTRKSKAEPDA